MATFDQNGIQFTATKGSVLPGKYSNGYNNNYNTAQEDGVSPLINAVEIDWNNAQLNLPEVFGGQQNISTTGQLLSIIQQLANAINNGSSQQSAISIDTQTTVNGIRHFAVSSSNAGSLNLSTTAGTLNKTAFTMVANTPQSFTLSNVGSAGKTPNITISSETVSNNSCTIYVTTDIASTLYMGVDNGAFGDMTSYSYQTSFDVRPNETASLQWINTSAYTYTNNPRITAWQTSPGTTAQSIDYTITAQQNNDVYSISGTLPGGKGQSITSYAYFDINLNNTPNPQTTYYYYAGWTLPTASNVDAIITETYPAESGSSTMNTAGKKTTSKSEMNYVNNTLYNANEKTYYYVLVPTGHNIYDSLNNNVSNSAFTSQGNITVGNQTHTIYKYNNTSRNINAIIIK